MAHVGTDGPFMAGPMGSSPLLSAEGPAVAWGFRSLLVYSFASPVKAAKSKQEPRWVYGTTWSQRDGVQNHLASRRREDCGVSHGKSLLLQSSLHPGAAGACDDQSKELVALRSTGVSPSRFNSESSPWLCVGSYLTENTSDGTLTDGLILFSFWELLFVPITSCSSHYFSETQRSFWEIIFFPLCLDFFLCFTMV